LNPAKHVFRHLAASEGVSRELTWEQITSFWAEALITTWQPAMGQKDAAMDSVEVTATRIANAPAGVPAFELVPGVLPFEQGKTYESIPYVLIPRILYPEKMDTREMSRSVWTVKLGVNSWEGTESSNVSIPTPAEAYWNFGWTGVFAIPLLMGGAIALLMMLAPKDVIGNAAYVVFVAFSLGEFNDMLMTKVPSIPALLVGAVLVRLFTFSEKAEQVNESA